jgi:predicted DNA-binding transcriptional regulator AlpA
MDGMQSIYMTVKEIMAFLRRSRAQVDRYRKLDGFPEAIVPSGTESGGVLYLRTEIFDWCRSRPRRILRPPADASV